MTWSDEYKIGLPVIDSQHKRLFQLIDALNEAIETGLEISDIENYSLGLGNIQLGACPRIGILKKQAQPYN